MLSRMRLSRPTVFIFFSAIVPFPSLPIRFVPIELSTSFFLSTTDFLLRINSSSQLLSLFSKKSILLLRMIQPVRYNPANKKKNRCQEIRSRKFEKVLFIQLPNFPVRSEKTEFADE